ncbi:type II toxin-antitoxin system HipA family toxin [Vampirovibrio sp.]|uniref:type II toxin-antitoxin system HipA family toxin n=1 Tax=Vampirovibrio sp. TaxID=2717857 RepID=UPI0035931A32
MANRALSVRLYGKHIGLLHQDENGKMGFQYAPGVTSTLTLSMPVKEEPYSQEVCEAYFGGLLPEGESARLAIGKRFGINSKNTFSLLKVIGQDCAGAVSLHEVAEPESATDLLPLSGRILDEKELAVHIKDLPTKPLFLGLDGLRLSLAGVQDKAAVCLLENEVALPKDGCPTTHILKPEIHLLKNTVQNEYFCLRIAQKLGFDVPNVEMRRANGVPYLLIERYDRERVGDKLRRIHQEDFCQALGITTTYKYQKEGGPGFQQCFELLKQTSQPAKARIRLAEIAIFNYLVGNTDAHGKNFSLLYKANGGIILAPFYDILCTQAYSGLTKSMAMEIGGEHQISNIRAEHWKNFSKVIGFTYPRIKTMIKDQLERLVEAAESERELMRSGDFDARTLDKMILLFKKQVFDATKRLELNKASQSQKNLTAKPKKSAIDEA